MGIVHEEEDYNNDGTGMEGSRHSKKKTSKGGSSTRKGDHSSMRKGSMHSPNSKNRDEPSMVGKLSKKQYDDDEYEESHDYGELDVSHGASSRMKSKNSGMPVSYQGLPSVMSNHKKQAAGLDPK